VGKIFKVSIVVIEFIPIFMRSFELWRARTEVFGGYDTMNGVESGFFGEIGRASCRERV
jgi:hypothetical protein